MASNSTTFTAACHCGNFHRKLTLPSSAFPLKSAICQCNSCRHVTGHLFATYAVIPGPLPDASWFTQLAKYSSSKTADRYFCPVCGASVINVDRGGGVGRVEWEFATGVLDFEDEQQGRDHERGPLGGRLNRVLLWVDDTKDGGALGWINEGRAEGLAGRYMKGRGSEVVTQEMATELWERSSGKRGADEVLEGRCHCGEVDIEVYAPAPDAIPKDCSAEFCCCTSCRKTTGFEITSWTHIKKDKVRRGDGEPYESLLKGLGHYESSPGTHRYFCRKCGATVFYNRKDLTRLDVALGLFDAPEGSRAENWFRWNPDKEDVAFLDDAVDKEFVNRLANGVGSTTRDAGIERVTTS